MQLHGLIAKLCPTLARVCFICACPKASCQGQLELFEDLGLYTESTDAALEIVRHEIERIESGGARHDENEHALVSGASCGSDIVFIEACIDRGLKVYVHLPYMEAKYVKEFVSYGGEDWIERLYNIRNNPRVNLYYQEERVGRAREGVDPYERNLRWALYASLVLGFDKLCVIALWDGISATAEDDDGKRVSGMVDLAQQFGGRVDHLNIIKLEYLFNLNSNVLERDPEAKVNIDSRGARGSTQRAGCLGR